MNDKERITEGVHNILQELSKLEADKGVEILNSCGKDCSKSSALFEGAILTLNKYAENEDMDIVFDTFKKQSYNTSGLKKEGNKITLIFEECICPLVKQGVNNSYLCNCTVGYFINIFKTLFNRPVKVKLLKSILNGDNVCEQQISIEE